MCHSDGESFSILPWYVDQLSHWRLDMTIHNDLSVVPKFCPHKWHVDKNFLDWLFIVVPFPHDTMTAGLQHWLTCGATLHAVSYCIGSENSCYLLDNNPFSCRHFFNSSLPGVFTKKPRLCKHVSWQPGINNGVTQISPPCHNTCSCLWVLIQCFLKCFVFSLPLIIRCVRIKYR